MIRFVTIGLLFAMTIGASAQSRIVIERPDRRGDTVRVQVSVSLAVPSPSGDGEETVKAQENARKTLYMIADKECALLRETLASECRLESINVNVNRQRHPNPEMINANASMTYRVGLK